MASRATSIGAVAGVVTALGVAGAVAEGLILSVESVPVAAGTGAIAGVAVGALVLYVVGGGQVQPGTRHLAVGAGLFAWIALILYLLVSSVGVENGPALLAGVAVGALVGIGAYARIREQDSRRVQAVTMR